MTSSRFWMVLAAAAALLVVTVMMRSAGMVGTERLRVGPDLDFVYKDVNGKDVRLADFKGKPVIVNLWATWCGPCVIEMPQLVELAKRYEGRITVVGISVDDTPDEIRAFAAEYKVTYPMLVGRGHEDELMKLGYVGNVPMTLFLDRDGHIRNSFVGIRTTETWERHIESLLE